MKKWNLGKIIELVMIIAIIVAFIIAIVTYFAPSPATTNCYVNGYYCGTL